MQFAFHYTAFPLVLKSELLVIVAAVMICLVGAKITIYTDSMASISLINAVLTEQLSLRKTTKLKHFNILKFLHRIILEFHISLKLIKVKSHDNDPNNEAVDSLAKQAYNN